MADQPQAQSHPQSPAQSQPRRQLLHTREVRCQGFLLDDNRWEIEGRMSDLKSFPMANPDRGGLIAVGEPLHDISLALTIDHDLVIHAVRAEIAAAPFAACSAISEAFQALKGMQLLPGFNRQAKELLGGVKGCTHLLELLGPIATTAYQTLWQSESGYNGNDPKVTGFLIDSCHALAREGEVVQTLAQRLKQTEALAELLRQKQSDQQTQQKAERLKDKEIL